jgi:hypothetical protein
LPHIRETRYKRVKQRFAEALKEEIKSISFSESGNKFLSLENYNKKAHQNITFGFYG